MQISENALVTLLLCSDIAVADTSPLSDMAYSALAQALFNESKQPSDLLNMTSDDISKLYGKYKKELFSKIRTNDFDIRIPALLKRHQQLLMELSDLYNFGIQVLTRADKSLYPRKIIQKFLKAGIAYPSVMFYCGDLSFIDNCHSIAVVGSRNYQNDITAEKFTGALIEKSVRDGWVISSGGAKGIDQLAFNSTVKSNGRSIITVSDSLIKKVSDSIVRKEIMNGNSLFLSLVNPKARFTGYNAMQRNKIIYAVSDYSFVVTCDCFSSINKAGKEVISMTKGGTWVGAIECASKNFSKLVVRKSKNAFRGNAELISMLNCPYIEEQAMYSDESIVDIINGRDPSVNGQEIQTDLFSMSS